MEGKRIKREGGKEREGEREERRKRENQIFFSKYCSG